jgi:hypothetical protein
LPTDTVIIDAGRVSVTSSVTIASVVLSNGILNLRQRMTVTNFVWAGGVLQGSFPARANLFIPSGGSLLITGSVEKVFDSAVLENAGDAWWSGSGDLRYGGSAGDVITNLPGGVFHTEATGRIYTPYSYRSLEFHNEGVFARTGATARTELATPFHNRGTVRVASGTLALWGTGLSTGHFVVEPAGHLSFRTDVGSYVLDGATLDSDGMVSIEGGQLGLTNVPAIRGRITVEGGTLYGDSEAVLPEVVWLSGGLGGQCTIAEQGTLWLTGPLPKSLHGCRLTNRGTVLWEDSGPIYYYGDNVISNAASGLFEVRTDAGFTTPYSYQSLSFHNAGTFVRAGDVELIAVGVSFYGSGTVRVEHGTLAFLVEGRCSGHFVVAVDATLSFQTTVGAWVLDAATLAPTGIVSVDGGVLTLTNVPSVARQLTVRGGLLWCATDTSLRDVVVTSGGLGGRCWIPEDGRLWVRGPDIKSLDNCQLHNAGRVLWEDTGHLYYYGDCAISNLATGVFEIRADANLTTPYAFQSLGFWNFGTLLRDGAAGTNTLVVLPVPFRNYGSLDLRSGMVSFVNGSDTGYQQEAGTTRLAGGAIASGRDLVFRGGSLAGHGRILGNVINTSQLILAVTIQ